MTRTFTRDKRTGDARAISLTMTYVCTAKNAATAATAGLEMKDAIMMGAVAMYATSRKVMPCAHGNGNGASLSFLQCWELAVDVRLCRQRLYWETYRCRYTRARLHASSPFGKTRAGALCQL